MASAACSAPMRLPLPAVERAHAAGQAARGGGGRSAPAHGSLRRVRRARPLLGTRVEIEAAGFEPVEHLHEAVNAAFNTIDDVQRLMSYHDPSSELSRLNRHARHSPQTVDGHTYRVLAAALRFAHLGEGAFDPCVASSLERWGYLPSMGGCAEASWRDIELSANEGVRFHRPLRIDLGGIAKGYAVDLAVQALQGLGIEEIVVNAGGDLRVAGPRARPVQLRHPDAPASAAHSLTLKDAALATSAAYFSRRRHASRDVSALVDPKSGDPYVGTNSVSVCAGDCMTADALTKILMFAPPAVSEGALAQCHARAVVLTPAHSAIL